jgi:hypothetical protein
LNIKNTLISYLLVISIYNASAQKPRIFINGYIRNDSVLSTRQAIYISETLASVIFPVPHEINALNQDPYAQPSASLMNLFPSITLFIDQIDFLNGTMESYLNGDFVGFILQSNQLAILNFFNKIKWDNHSLMFGYAPHPLISPDIYPNTVNANNSSPITPLSINPQIQYRWQDKHAVVKGTFYSEYLFTNDGPGIPEYPFNYISARFSNTYSRDAFAPSCNLTLELYNNCGRIGIAGDVSFHRPRLYEITPNPYTNQEENFSVNTFLKSFKVSAYGGTKVGSTYINVQCLYGQNGMDIQSLGGYASIKTDDSIATPKYTNINFISCWIDINFPQHPKYQPGLYIGYAKNFGSKKTLEEPRRFRDFYFSIDRYATLNFPLQQGLTNQLLYNMIRIVPRLWIYPHEKLAIGIETELIKTGNKRLTLYCPLKLNNATYNWMLHGMLSVQYMF